MIDLLLLRHAKAEPAEPGQSDAARPLAARGIRQAKALGQRFVTELRPPDRVLCSPAERTRQTLAAIAPFLSPSPSVSVLDRLYGGDAETYRHVIAKIGGDAQRVLVVGHNPAIREFAVSLVGPGAASTLAKFPAGALAVVTLRAATWEEMAAGSGRLSEFLLPDDG